MVKYHQLAIKESVSDHICTVNKIVLVVVVDQLLVEDAGNHQLPKEGSEDITGGIKNPSHVHQEVVIMNQLKFICM